MAISTFARDLDDVVDPGAHLRLLADGFRFAEGPLWDQRDASLLFNDIRADSRWRWTQAGGAELVAHPNRIGNGMVFDGAGHLLACEHVTSCVVRTSPDGLRDVVAWHYRGRYLNSPNDLVTRSDGLVYFTDPDYGRWDDAVGVARPRELGFTGLFRVRPGGAVELAAPPETFDQPNGLCFSPDESTLYVDDVRGVYWFDVAADGTLGPVRSLLGGMGGGEDGSPDGIKCDADGNIWCAARGGVWVIDPSGSLLGVLETPEIVANLAWGGDDLRTLFLCTSTTIHAVRTRVPSAPLPYHARTRSGRSGSGEAPGAVGADPTRPGS